MSEALAPHRCLSRRDLVRGGIAGVGVVCLAACSGSPEEAPPDEQSPEPEPTGEDGGENGNGAAENGDDAGEDGEGGGEAIAALDDIPVGGALIAELDGEPIALTRIDEDTVAAFSAICTHEGCQVRADEGELACPCHGSRFDLADGEAIAGPANDPLPSIDVQVVDGQVVVA